MDEMTLTLNSPITDEQWDAITDVDFEHTDRIWFHTKHGKEVEFVKRKKGRWIWDDEGYHCSECFFHAYGNTLERLDGTFRYCPNCGAEMEGDRDATD